jgi:regulator of sigma E protease
MTTTIIFLLVLTLLVFIHELGHFLAARLFRIRVDEFAIGFPPRIWSFMKKGTRFAINIVPLGGYVKIHGENGEDEVGPDGKPFISPDSILAKPRWQQAVVLVMGVTFNVILAWLLISVSFMFGTRSSVEGFPESRVADRSVMIMYVAADSPAEKAGLRMGDDIVSVISTGPTGDAATSTVPSTLNVKGVQDVIAGSQGPVTFVIKHTTDESGKPIGMERDKIEQTDIVVQPKEGVVAGKRAVGISMEEVGTVKLGFWGSLGYGAKATWVMLDNIASGLWQFVKNLFIAKGGASEALKTVTGPVGIASIVGSSARQGVSALLLIVAIISANLAVINLVPFPALDGGRLVIVAIEGIIRRRLNPKIVNYVNVIGFFLLIGLMLVVSVKDVWVMFR